MTDRSVNSDVTSRSLEFIVDPFFTKTQMQHVLVDLSNQNVFVNRTRHYQEVVHGTTGSTIVEQLYQLKRNCDKRYVV